MSDYYFNTPEKTCYKTHLICTFTSLVRTQHVPIHYDTGYLRHIVPVPIHYDVGSLRQIIPVPIHYDMGYLRHTVPVISTRSTSSKLTSHAHYATTHKQFPAMTREGKSHSKNMRLLVQSVGPGRHSGWSPKWV